ncbi:malonyl-CoA synthase [Thalassovita sp.]|uniref:malonate--CoA ligase n=1 Tax=Thalassovita sp. TaxID=1979401 RepID=UPI002AB11922|nr:malonyl-CoA synthase [Thalassovita sp.]
MTNTLYDALIGRHASQEVVFLETDDGSRITYAQFIARAAQFAHVLVQNGVSPGDRLVVQAPKRWEVLALYAASLQAGAVYLPLNTAYTTEELRYFIGDAAPKLVLCTPDAQAALTPIAEASAAALLTLDAAGMGSLAEAAQSCPEEFQTVPRGPDDLAALLYTSGTTGRSKGAMLTHGNMLSNAEALVALWQITEADRLIHALPIFHTHGLFVAMNTALLAGVEVRLMERFSPDQILAELPHSTMLMGVPTFYTRLLGDARLTRAACAQMRLFISGSAPLLAETHEAFEARSGHRILERYGMTETNMNTSNPYDGARRAGTVGKPLPGVEVQITQDGQPLAQGEIGMIEVRGPNVFKGYWNMPDKTAEELRDSGYFITGDLGRIDDQGYLSIVGREKDLIISGGYNIYPKEIEDVLNDIPGVLESAVYGVADADFGEAVCAAIVAEPGTEVPQEVLQTEVAQKLARFKHPRHYRMLPELPRNTMGKVQKNILRQEFTPS